MWIDVTALLVLGLVLSLFIPSICNPWNNPPPVPSFPQQRSAVIDMVDNLAIDAPVIVELGAGWGGLSSRLTLSGTVIAVEKSHLLYWWLRCRLHALGVRVLRADAQSLPAWECCQAADIVIMYLSRGLNRSVTEHLPPGVHVISVCFECPNLSLIAQRDTIAGPVFLYRS